MNRRAILAALELNVELIITGGTAATLAAKNATTRIPIVMIAAGDPVRTGLVADLAKPGGNVTGHSFISADLEAKRLSLLRELLPGVQRIGVLINPRSVANTCRLGASRSRSWRAAFGHCGFER